MALIMVVDDREDDLELTEEILTDSGHSVLLARNWLEGTTLLKRENPDLVLLDINMPEIKGTEGLQILRRNSRRKLPKILLYSGEDKSRLKDLAYIHWADGYVQKGEDIHRLAEIVAEILARSKEESPFERKLPKIKEEKGDER